MPDKAWKRLERNTAKYFGTQRRVRGSDFGESDIEILASVYDWLGEEHAKDIGIAVECKYRKKHPIIDIIHKSLKDRIGIVTIGNYILCRLEDFETIYKFIINPWPDLNGYLVLSIDSKHLPKLPPKYLDDYREQVVKYSIRGDKQIVLPVVCMAQAKTRGTIVSIHLNDIEEFSNARRYRAKQQAEDKNRVSQTIN